jgi:hypothetical protein
MLGKQGVESKWNYAKKSQKLSEKRNSTFKLFLNESLPLRTYDFCHAAVIEQRVQNACISFSVLKKVVIKKHR